MLGYMRMRDDGQLAMRVVASLELASAPWDFGAANTDEHIRFNLAHAALLQSKKDPILRFNGATFGVDGPCWCGLLRMEKPYLDAYGRPTTGHEFNTKKMQREVIHYCLKHKIRLNLIQAALFDHRQFLEIVDDDQLADAVRRGDWVAQHNMLITEDTIRRYADLKLHSTISMSFRWGKGDMYRERMGDEIMDMVVPVGRHFASGANVSLGQDWSPFSPFEHMKLAQTGELARSDFPCNPETHTISAQQALDGWTVNTAKLMQWEDIGALKPGFKADIAIVDHNPLTADVDGLAKTEVLRTVFDGRDVYDTGYIARIDESPLPRQHPNLAR
ncbi:amidohydrolase family protein [Bradyrhizobium sp. 24]|uniref:amidohydrolase family protein n=1 Tax=unclassified Bradyrhizobium TaxID=2631580 RepID=UPI001FFA9BD0|nr:MULTISPECIES: amidohydrolase family protein [unclassified Bradyrhizobium]MCK1297392.1 amidohydrolase family protein [Bradyrhizobium sp. 37]MCK1377636.1 amidohydrolase family protein [Bradyrhizobium sp. 24]MCK1769120.1 amidohydrolase family protein [Bradyrhizobium sp. 134]